MNLPTETFAQSFVLLCTVEKGPSYSAYRKGSWLFNW